MYQIVLKHTCYAVKIIKELSLECNCCVFISLLVGVPVDVESLVTERINAAPKCSNSEILLHKHKSVMTG
jgi:hypothetical protein